MHQFSNFYNATVDDKRRVVLPSAYKNELLDGDACMVTVEIDPYDPCLNIYPEDAWNIRINQITSSLNPNDKMHSRFLDKFYQQFVQIKVATNGRMNIPNHILEAASIEKDVIFSGQGTKIRLWDEVKYQNLMMSDEEYTNLFENLLGNSL